MNIIAIHSKIGQGKSALGQALQDVLEEECGRGSATIISFAQELKCIARETFGWNGVKDDRGRRLLQLIGGCGRCADPFFWVDKWTDLVDMSPAETGTVIVDDVRYQNELDRVRDMNGLAIKLFARTTEAPQGVPGHSSEKGLPDDLFDLVLDNREGTNLVELAAKVLLCARQHQEGLRLRVPAARCEGKTWHSPRVCRVFHDLMIASVYEDIQRERHEVCSERNG